MKDRNKGQKIVNFRPIFHLLLIYKLFTGILAEGIYGDLEKRNLTPGEQEEWQKKFPNIKYQNMIDQTISKNCKKKTNGLKMVWFNYKSVQYDPSFLHREVLRTFECSTRNWGFIRKFMLEENWEGSMIDAT